MEQLETEVSKIEPEEEEKTEVEELEDEEKKSKKKGAKKSRKVTKKEVVEIATIVQKKNEEEPSIKIPGLKNIKLSSLTQKIMGCIVGEHVTSESPWTTISKVVVDENLYLHHESSDFLPVKDDLMEYTDSTILVGYDLDYMPAEGDDFHRFYIAVTEKAREKVLKTLEEEKRLAEERLKNSINKKIFPWTSLGSEAEVDESIVRNTRPLIQLELETDIDELLKPVKFQDRNVDDVKDGYVRIGPGRQEFKGVTKMRVDAAIQSVPSVTPNAAQTDPGLPTNAWTQYLYDMQTAQDALQQSEIKELKSDYVFPEHAYLESALEYNENFDLYLNDYPLLVLRETNNGVPHKSVFEEYEAYTDVDHSNNKLISAIAWHPRCTGVVALAYALAVRCANATDIDVTGDEVNRDVFSKNSVLVWTFKNALKPLLILQSPREVHALSWSPVDSNLLIGGCTSGQIIIWDVTGKVETLEGHEYLTPDQQRYRLVMQSLIGWLQPQPPAQYVRPAALSNLQFSHGGRVTRIQWIPPTLELTENGHLIKTEVTNGKGSMQFFTSGEDGVVMVWDLNKTPDDLGPGKPRKRKARKRPSALTATISPFKTYDRKIRPIYMLYPELRGKKSAKLTSLSFRTIPMKYRLMEVPAETKKEEVVEKVPDLGKSSTTVMVKEHTESEEESQESREGSQVDLLAEEKKRAEVKSKKEVKEELKEQEETDSKKEERDEERLKAEESEETLKTDSMSTRKKYYPVIEPLDPPPQLIQVATDDGETIIVKWEGFDFHKGEEITTEEGSALCYGGNFHDGPIVACVRSPFIEDLVLTVGGRVIALWTHELKNRPFFWKNCPVVVTCASWSPYRPCLFHVGRSDGSIEVWDLTSCSDSPSLVQSISGKVLTDMSEHSLPLFGGKAILGVADYNNSFRLLYFPEDYIIPKPNELETLKEFVWREVNLRITYEAWNETFIKSNAEELARIKAKEEEAERKHKEAELAAEQEAQLRAKLEEEEAKQMAKNKGGMSLSERFFERTRQERERQMQRVLMEKKRLNKSDLMAKQKPILMMKQMEKEKRRKQREKIRQQQKIFDKTVAMLFPEVVEKPKEGHFRMDTFESEFAEQLPEIMYQYDQLVPAQLKFVKDNPFNKRLKWEKVFEEGMLRRNVLDFPLYLRQSRQERYMESKTKSLDYAMPVDGKKPKVGFKGLDGDEDKDDEEEEEEEEEFYGEGEEEEEVDEEAGDEEGEIEEGGEENPPNP